MPVGIQSDLAELSTLASIPSSGAFSFPERIREVKGIPTWTASSRTRKLRVSINPRSSSRSMSLLDSSSAILGGGVDGALRLVALLAVIGESSLIRELSAHYA